jgi:DNA-binding GntR family transcriptional regulator
MSYTLTGTRKEAVLRQLRDEIVSSRLTPGTVLKDAEVAARLGVSITPVREAIGQLAAEGLIDIAPNRTRQVTAVTPKNALELVDVMCVLACAGVEWGVANLEPADLIQLRFILDAFAEYLRQGDTAAAAATGAEFTTVVVQASGNRELQTHIDLVVTRSLRMLALTAESRVWQVWLDGYGEMLKLLEAGDSPAAVRRYRQIYVEYRTCVQTLLFT